MITFFKEVYSELLKVSWPTWRKTLQYTILVMIFSVVLAAILGAMDYGLVYLLEKTV